VPIVSVQNASRGCGPEMDQECSGRQRNKAGTHRQEHGRQHKPSKKRGAVIRVRGDQTRSTPIIGENGSGDVTKRDTTIHTSRVCGPKLCQRCLSVNTTSFCESCGDRSINVKVAPVRSLQVRRVVDRSALQRQQYVFERGQGTNVDNFAMLPTLKRPCPQSTLCFVDE